MANKTQQVIFARHSNNLRKDEPFSSQRALNVYAEAGQGDDYAQLLMRHGSGLRKTADLGGPVRAMRFIAGTLYAAGGGAFWSITEEGEADRIADIPDDDLTFISGNRVQVAVSAGGRIFVMEGGAFQEATDIQTPRHVTTMDQLDGFGIVTIEDSDQFYTTNLVDFNDVNPLEFASAESNPDRIVRVLVDHREVWVFGSRTVEIWYNAGTSPFPLARASEATMEHGLVGVHTPAKMDNSVFWVADDLEVKRSDGYVPTRISTHAIERIIQDLSPEQREQMRGFTWAEEGHKFYALWMPGQTTWVYDANTGMWHERSTDNAGEPGSWLAWETENAYGHDWAGSFDGGIYRIDRDFYHDGDIPIHKMMISPPVHFGDARFVAQYFAADMRCGWPASEEWEPQIVLSLSRDRGHTWTRRGGKGLGRAGEFNKLLRWWGLGLQRELYAKIECRDPIAFSLYAAHVRYKVGSS